MRRPPFVSRVRQTLKRRDMLARGDRVLCAVSGGADSLALCDALAMLRRELGFEMAVAHVDHGLRDDSADDAERVAAFARSLGLEALSRRVRVRPRGSREEAAREARWTALEEMAAAWGATRIAVGHTATDRAETLLLFLARGTGRRGLGSMQPVRDGRVIRPLCEVTRAETREYARARGLPFSDDPTNDDRSLSRNRVRAEVLPALRRINPRADQALAALAQDLAEEEAFLAAEAGRFRPVFEEAAGVWSAPARALAELPPVLRTRLLREVLEEVRGTRRALGRRHLLAVQGLLAPGAREVHLPGATAWRDGGAVRIARRKPPAAPLPAPLQVSRPGVYSPQAGIEFELRVFQRGERGPGGTSACFDADVVRFPLWIRPWRPGDRVQLEGGGRRKVADALAEARIPVGTRGSWFLCADEEEVLWVPGVRQSAHGRVSERTQKVLSIRARGLMFPDPCVNQMEESEVLRVRKGEP